jgi:hypothetical protein
MNHLRPCETPLLHRSIALALLAGACAELPVDAPSEQSQALEELQARVIDSSPPWATDGCPELKLYEPYAEGGELAGAWKGEPLFAAAQLGDAYVPTYHPYAPGVLQTYCLFTWYPDPAHPKAFRPYAETKDSSTQPAAHLEAEDQPVVSGLEPMPSWSEASGLDRADIQAALRKVVRRQWGIEELEAAAFALDSEPSVDVAIVDNAPYGSDPTSAPQAAPHARVVSAAVREVACSLANTPACPVELGSHLALPQRTATEADWKSGGYFGTRGQLAVAIWDAVMRAELEGKGKKLVINLSVGWLSHGGPLDAAELAVRDAIALARCRGHLVIAAAGNRASPFDVEAGALLPGAFEREHTPHPLQCRKAFALPHTIDKPESYDPLVFAVGALDAGDRPIATTRVAGRPPLAAYGFAVPDLDGAEEAKSGLAPLSGSSLAAAAVSGIAALVWALAPELSAAQVMQIVYDSGADLSVRPGAASDFQLPPGSHPPRNAVHRASLCNALRAVAPGLVSCPNRVDAYEGSLEAMTFWSALPDAEGSARKLDRHDAFRLTEGSDSVHAPWVGPQPTSPGCSTCRLVPHSALSLPLDEADAYTLDVAVTDEIDQLGGDYELLLTTESAGVQTSYLVDPPHDAARSYRVTIPYGSSVQRAALSFRQSSGGAAIATYEPILVQ